MVNTFLVSTIILSFHRSFFGLLFIVILMSQGLALDSFFAECTGAAPGGRAAPGGQTTGAKKYRLENATVVCPTGALLD